ncbi:MAG: choice-of-anchor D domain-containing protein [Myxococcota bacterium]
MNMNSRLSLLVVAALAASLAGCDCGSQTRKRFPKIEVLDDQGNTRTSVEFGDVQMNFTGTKKVRVRNSGASALTLEKAEFSKALFGVGTTLPVTIAVGEEFEVPLTFTPATADQRETGTATITSDDPDKPTVQLSLAGKGVTATAVVQPTTLDFGEVYVGESKELTFSLTNSGSNELPVTTAELLMADPGLTGDLTPLRKTLAGGETVMVTLRFAPTQQTILMGSLSLTFPNGVPAKTIPLVGKGIQAVPKLCFKFDDSAFERCTDGTVGMTLDVPFGALCDRRVYPIDGGLPCELDGGLVPWERSGKLYVRNEGNTPISYSLNVTAGQPGRCDGGASIDYAWSNAPAQADGGTPATFMVATTRLPMLVTDPKPWETAPVTVVYRPQSRCRGGDDSDLSTIIWTRQGEPLGTMRRPNTMLATLNGSSILAQPVPNGVTFTGNSPTPQDVTLVSNTGDGPVRLLAVELWQSADGGLTPTERCATATSGACTHYAWLQGPTVPTLLEGTNVPAQRVTKVLGRLAYGELNDAGMYQVPSLEQRVWAIVDTSDPYTPQVVVPIVGRLQ